MTESTRNRSRSKSRHAAVTSDRPLFPVWAPPLVMIAVTITGLVLAAETGTAPMAYFVLFAVACVVCTVLVESRGLFLTVAAQPLYFLIGALAIGWLSSQATAGNSSKTKLITAIYPTIEHFLWLLIPFLISVVIAVIRWRHYRRVLARPQREDVSARRRRRTSEDSNLATYSRSRRYSGDSAADSETHGDKGTLRSRADGELSSSLGQRGVGSRSSRGESRQRAENSARSTRRHGGNSNSRSVEELIRRSEERRASRAERDRNSSGVSDRGSNGASDRTSSAVSDRGSNGASDRTSSAVSDREGNGVTGNTGAENDRGRHHATGESHGRHYYRSRSPLPKKRAPYLDEEFTIEED